MTSAPDTMAAQRTGLVGRWWFAGIGACFLLVAIVGFVPQSLALRQRGVIFPIELHLHAAIMGLLLIAFIVQSTLAGRGDVAMHRRLGVFAAVLGATAWLSMLVVLDSAMRRENPFELPFLPNVLTLGMLQSVLFLALFTPALVTRGRPAWHRRLLAFALLSTLLGALMRTPWLPSLPLPSYWGQGACVWLYVLALPLLVFDLATLRRLHPATLVGLGAITVFNAVLAALWDNDDYKSLFLETWRQVYGS